jgi:hypothetical protein
MTLRDLLGKLKGARRSGKGWTARCPAHDDHNCSLSIGEGTGTHAPRGSNNVAGFSASVWSGGSLWPEELHQNGPRAGCDRLKCASKQ